MHKIIYNKVKRNIEKPTSPSSPSLPSLPLPPSPFSKTNKTIKTFFVNINLKNHSKTKNCSKKIKIIDSNKNDNDLLREEQEAKKLKLIDYAEGILNNHANSVWPNFYETPEEPAKRTMDDIKDTEWIGYGKLSMSPYDTAWMAMVPSEKYKSTNLPKDFELAFPQCLKWFFYHQDDNGSWAGKDAKSVLPCLAGLLALGLFRSRSGNYLEEKLNDLGLTLSQFDSSFEKSVNFLNITLNQWNIDEIDYVGFELTVPYMLNELEKLKPSVVFQFPDKQRLIKEHTRKMNLIPIEALFALAAKRQPVAMIHSIEAFGNKIDFTKIQNEGFQAINGSYGSSAAATASVLINSPNWDPKAYKFLQKIIARVPAGGTSLGYVPTISDVGIFETAWIMQPMVEFVSKVTKFYNNNNTSDNKLIQSLLEKNKITAKFIRHVVNLQKDTVRWTSWDNRIPADVDTTATCHWVIDQILPETECNLKKLGAAFYNGRNFVTYPGERTVSISSNVHALRLLLAKYSKDKSGNNEVNYIITMQTKTEAGKKITIQQVISTVIELIMANRSEMATWSDKWNASPSYITHTTNNLLLSLLSYPEIVENSTLKNQDNLLEYCLKTVNWCLQTQHSDGSWGSVSEIGMGTLKETSYCIRLLNYSSKFYPGNLEIPKALKKARKFVYKYLDEAMNDDEFFYQKQPLLWIGKQLFSLPNIIRSSVLVSLWED
ncbi:1965_t:CDS:2 [Entrophospora sp. SA101]|nr:1965_t:CDS:2 [Entrophospora sp. SA101]